MLLSIVVVVVLTLTRVIKLALVPGMRAPLSGGTERSFVGRRYAAFSVVLFHSRWKVLLECWVGVGRLQGRPRLSASTEDTQHHAQAQLESTHVPTGTGCAGYAHYYLIIAGTAAVAHIGQLNSG